MKIEQHWLSEARHVPSPNFNERPAGIVPELIVVHCISLPPGQFGGAYVEQFFQNCLCAEEHPYFGEIHNMEVSSHVFIRRDGEVIQVSYYPSLKLDALVGHSDIAPGRKSDPGPFFDWEKLRKALGLS